MNAFTRRDALLIALTLAVIVLPLLAGGNYVWRKHQWANEQLQTLAPRYARLAGLQDKAPELTQRLAASRKRLGEYVYSADSDPIQAGNDAMQRVRAVFAQAGLTVASTQVLPGQKAQGFDRIPLVLRVEGELLHLQSALAVLPGLTPVVLVDGMAVQTTGQRRPDDAPRLVVQFNLSVLHAKAP
jgi:general secretion pathway protein M